ncbi:MAG: hypothetical protein WB820_18300, partial [Rhodoplanes sp.]
MKGVLQHSGRRDRTKRAEIDAAAGKARRCVFPVAFSGGRPMKLDQLLRRPYQPSERRFQEGMRYACATA